MKQSELPMAHLISDEDLTTEEIKEQLYRAGDKSRLYTEMEMNSAWADIHGDISYKPEPAYPHSHEFWEFLFCVQGNIPYIIGREQYQIQPGDVIVIPPGVSHSLLPWNEEDGIYQRNVLWCSPQLAYWITAQLRNDLLFSGQGRVLRLTLPQKNYLRQLMRVGIRETRLKLPGYQVALTGIALQVLANLSRISADQQANPQTEHSRLLLKILDYVQENLSGDLTVSTTARQFSVSDSSLSHLFQKEMGIGFYRYVLQQRLTESKNLIYQGLPMETVANQVGFGNYSAFYRAFKKEFGISPIQYKQLLPK